MTPHEHALADASSGVVSCGFNPATAEAISNIVIRAYLRARREIDGAVLCRVPEEMDWRHAEGAAQGFKVKGWNACRSETLASAEANDADV